MAGFVLMCLPNICLNLSRINLLSMAPCPSLNVRCCFVCFTLLISLRQLLPMIVYYEQGDFTLRVPALGSLTRNKIWASAMMLSVCLPVCRLIQCVL